jgi:hypothetical protein
MTEKTRILLVVILAREAAAREESPSFSGLSPNGENIDSLLVEMGGVWADGPSRTAKLTTMQSLLAAA